MVGIHHQFYEERIGAVERLRHAVDNQLGSPVGAGLRPFENDLVVDLRTGVASQRASTSKNTRDRRDEFCGRPICVSA